MRTIHRPTTPCLLRGEGRWERGEVCAVCYVKILKKKYRWLHKALLLLNKDVRPTPDSAEKIVFIISERNMLKHLLDFVYAQYVFLLEPIYMFLEGRVRKI